MLFYISKKKTHKWYFIYRKRNHKSSFLTTVQASKLCKMPKKYSSHGPSEPLSHGLHPFLTSLSYLIPPFLASILHLKTLPPPSPLLSENMTGNLKLSKARSHLWHFLWTLERKQWKEVKKPRFKSGKKRRGFPHLESPQKQILDLKKWKRRAVRRFLKQEKEKKVSIIWNGRVGHDLTHLSPSPGQLGPEQVLKHCSTLLKFYLFKWNASKEHTRYLQSRKMERRSEEHHAQIYKPRHQQKQCTCVPSYHIKKLFISIF